MRKPVIPVVERDLLLTRAVRPHAPDLHGAGTVRTEVNPLPVRRVIRPIIEPLRGGQARLAAAGDGNCVNVDLAAALRAVGERPAIRRPAVPVRRSRLRDELRRAAGDGQRVDARAPVAFRLIADGELRAVGRDPVVVVAARSGARFDELRLAAGYRDSVHASLAVE